MELTFQWGHSKQNNSMSDDNKCDGGKAGGAGGKMLLF